MPSVTGPESGQPGDTLAFCAVSQDCNRRELSYMFDWGDGTPTMWGPTLPAGDTLRQQHVYSDSGRCQVRVRTRNDLQLESNWSEGFPVVIRYLGPLTPNRPQGPSEAYSDTTVIFTTSAGHVRGESVSVQFDWGDTLGDWSDYAAPSAEIAQSHTYRRLGSYSIRARARDRAGNISPWSANGNLLVLRRPLEPPSRLRLSASAGVLVRLSWDRGRNPDSTQYRVWFRPQWSRDFSVVGITYGSQTVHDPAGETGDYFLSASYQNEELLGADTLSTIPVFSDTVILVELNAGELAGYGWDSLTRNGRTGTMRDSSQAGLVDLYLTDLTPGYLGSGYYLASPSFGPGDPGGVVPPGRWRETRMVGVIGSPQEPLPEFDSLYYQRVVDVSSFISHVAVYTQEGYYALVTTYGPDPNRGTIPLQSWFQRVRGLRLIRHPEDVRAY